ncbi:MAG: hypothetical protein ACU0DI_12615 [Paracoccaceae bacterium]
MTRFITGLLIALLLSACGADGEPLTPRYSADATIGFNSKTGAYHRTVFGIEIGG